MFIYNNLGFAYANNKEYKKALNILSQSFELEKNFVNAFGIALVSYKLGNQTQAIDMVNYLKNIQNIKTELKNFIEYMNVKIDTDMDLFLKNNNLEIQYPATQSG